MTPNALGVFFSVDPSLRYRFFATPIFRSADVQRSVKHKKRPWTCFRNESYDMKYICLTWVPKKKHDLVEKMGEIHFVCTFYVFSLAISSTKFRRTECVVFSTEIWSNSKKLRLCRSSAVPSYLRLRSQDDMLCIQCISSIFVCVFFSENGGTMWPHSQVMFTLFTPKYIEYIGDIFMSAKYLYRYKF